MDPSDFLGTLALTRVVRCVATQGDTSVSGFLTTLVLGVFLLREQLRHSA